MEIANQPVILTLNPRPGQSEAVLSEQQRGAIALVGSGEYTTAMGEVDSFLLDTLGGTARRVVVIPTASALEPGMPQVWNERGVRHFQALGAVATPLPLIMRDDALRPEIVAALEDGDFFYFSGGSPDYLIETLRGTPAWATILARHHAGAVLAGCSAGAMMMSGATLRVREVVAGNDPRWVTAMGVVPNIAVLPHFDRMVDFAGAAVFTRIIATAPDAMTLVGVDEDTALVGTLGGSGISRWQVMGRQTVSVYSELAERMVYAVGDVVFLPARGEVRSNNE